ncbi:hypothetical protein PG985_016066 [Apiospora marii]|uniref:Nephrocystin 3-like N-terminal domain-containing protein n=1 Tax=Apiospora marii TaxID=335849 RepID=A0ABR1S4W8_9PEZI
MSNALSGQGALIHGQDNYAAGRDLFINTTFAQDGPEGGQRHPPALLSQKRREDHLKSLHFADMEDRRWNVKRAHAETCEWFLKTSKYLAWSEGNHEHKHGSYGGFFWIKGKPGAGKSTLMKFLLSRAGQTKRFGVILSFFFNARAGDVLKRSTLGLYRSLSAQLLEERPLLQDVLDEFPTGHQWGIESLKMLLELAFEALGDIPVACFIDALDECQEQEIRDMITHLSDLCHVQTQLRVCFSSRHYPHISVPKGGHSIVLEESQEHDEDICRYIDHTLRIDDEDLSATIRAELIKKASGVFMWVVLVVPILNKTFDAGGKHKLQERLRQIPGDLNELFRDMLTRDESDAPSLLLCIQWVLFAKRPLTPKELYFAIISGMDPESLAQCHSDKITNDDFTKFTLDKSKGLTELTKSTPPTIQFIHESVRDFLLKDYGLAEIWPHGLVNLAGQSHQALKQACLTYMESNHIAYPWTGNLSPTSMLERYFQTSAPFLRYAVHNILFHANMAEAHGYSQGQFLATFPFEKWVTYRNAFSEKDNRYTPNVSILYILASNGLDALINVYPVGHSCLAREQERYGTPLFAALNLDRTDAAKALIKRQISMQTKSLSPQILSLRASEYQSVLAYFTKVWCDFGMSHSGKAGDESTYPDGEEFVFRLLKRMGCSPLAFAAGIGHVELASFLIDMGADVDSTNQFGWSPLQVALDMARLGAAIFLIDKGADVNITNHGWSPLSIATHGHHHDMVALLTQRGAFR